MKFLLDENQSPVLAELLGAAGHDVVHARNIGLKSAPDSTVLETAAETGRVLISGDTDFGFSPPRTLHRHLSCSSGVKASDAQARSPLCSS